MLINGVELRKKSGRKDLPESERRIHSVNVRLNDAELAELDKARSRFQRAEALRMLALTSLPSPINTPTVNSELAANIGRTFGNLATLATAIRSGEFVELAIIKKELQDLQFALKFGSKK